MATSQEVGLLLGLWWLSFNFPLSLFLILFVLLSLDTFLDKLVNTAFAGKHSCTIKMDIITMAGNHLSSPPPQLFHSSLLFSFILSFFFKVVFFSFSFPPSSVPSLACWSVRWILSSAPSIITLILQNHHLPVDLFLEFSTLFYPSSPSSYRPSLACWSVPWILSSAPSIITLILKNHHLPVDLFLEFSPLLHPSSPSSYRPSLACWSVPWILSSVPSIITLILQNHHLPVDLFLEFSPLFHPSSPSSYRTIPCPLICPLNSLLCSIHHSHPTESSLACWSVP